MFGNFAMLLIMHIHIISIPVTLGKAPLSVSSVILNPCVSNWSHLCFLTKITSGLFSIINNVADCEALWLLYFTQ